MTWVRFGLGLGSCSAVGLDEDWRVLEKIGTLNDHRNLQVRPH